MGTTFTHPNIGNLAVRLAPTSVEWSFNLVTSVTPTYAGEVVQVLAINIDRIVVEGQFGKEGPHGAFISDGQLKRRSTSELRDFTSSGLYARGLTQMTEYFQRYFAVASQGHDARVAGHFDQVPMTLNYSGTSDIGFASGQTEGPWQIYPINFPSYARSLEEFAPKWRVECEVFEAPEAVKTATQKDVIKQLSQTDAGAFRPGIGFRPFNPFSDPAANPGDIQNAPNFQNLSPSQKRVLLQKAQDKGNQNLDKLFDKWRSMLPAYDDATLMQLITVGGSMSLSDLGDGGIASTSPSTAPVNKNPQLPGKIT